MNVLIDQWMDQFVNASLEVDRQSARTLKRRSILASLVLCMSYPSDSSKALHQLALKLDYSIDSERSNFVSLLRVVSTMYECRDEVDANTVAFVTQVLNDSIDGTIVIDKANWESATVDCAFCELFLGDCFVSIYSFSFGATEATFYYDDPDHPNLERESDIIRALWPGPHTISFGQDAEAVYLVKVIENPCKYVCYFCCYPFC